MQNSEAQTLLVTGKPISQFTPKKHVQNLIAVLKYGSFELTELLMDIFKTNVNQLLIEGGSESIWRFVKQGLVNEVICFISPQIIGGNKALTPVGGVGFQKLAQSLQLAVTETKNCGPDVMVRCEVQR
jgi:diaminohydroxyphosphoribosylaminopyrimidine deaminase/5-amino-6-(5-phosphoribosylamino)uracil reductase